MAFYLVQTGEICCWILFICPCLFCQLLYLPSAQSILDSLTHLCTNFSPSHPPSEWHTQRCKHRKLKARGLALLSWRHNVLIYTEHPSVCPFVGIGTPPTPLPQASVPSPHQRVGGTLACGCGGWGVLIPTAGEKA